MTPMAAVRIPIKNIAVIAALVFIPIAFFMPRSSVLFLFAHYSIRQKKALFQVEAAYFLFFDRKVPVSEKILSIKKLRT